MVLRTDSLSKKYDNTEQYILQDINLVVEEGEFICLIGPSGCGKTTLLNIIAGLEKPTKGKVLLDEVEIEGPGADRVVIFQEAALFPWLNVFDNVKFGLKVAKKTREEQEQKAIHYLDMVNLLKFKDYHVHQLSGGMRQRVAMARALALDSKILLMDEPFSALDKQTINILRDEIQELWMKTRKTVIFITHSVEEALLLGDKVVMLSSDPGKIKNIYEIKMDRPRHIDDPEFIKLRAEVLNHLRTEVEKVAKKEYDEI